MALKIKRVYTNFRLCAQAAEALHDMAMQFNKISPLTFSTRQVVELCIFHAYGKRLSTLLATTPIEQTEYLRYSDDPENKASFQSIRYMKKMERMKIVREKKRIRQPQEDKQNENDLQ